MKKDLDNALNLDQFNKSYDARTLKKTNVNITVLKKSVTKINSQCNDAQNDRILTVDQGSWAFIWRKEEV